MNLPPLPIPSGPVGVPYRLFCADDMKSFASEAYNLALEEAAAELRRLHAENEELQAELSIAMLAIETQRKRIKELEQAKLGLTDEPSRTSDTWKSEIT